MWQISTMECIRKYFRTVDRCSFGPRMSERGFQRCVCHFDKTTCMHPSMCYVYVPTYICIFFNEKVKEQITLLKWRKYHTYLPNRMKIKNQRFRLRSSDKNSSKIKVLKFYYITIYFSMV